MSSIKAFVVVKLCRYVLCRVNLINVHDFQNVHNSFSEVFLYKGNSIISYQFYPSVDPTCIKTHGGGNILLF